MTTLNYEISADEAWTHGANPPNRYWCFLGGVFGPESDIDRLESKLKACGVSYSYLREAKYGSVSDQNLGFYKAFVDTFLSQIQRHDLHYRQLFLDRSNIYVPDPTQGKLRPIDVQFRIYYQFLKHAFGLRHLPRIRGKEYRIVLHLDEHTSQAHKITLKEFVEELNTQFGRNDTALVVRFVKSTHFRRIQACDVLVGVAGSYGNKHDLRRPGSRRGMSVKQRCRLELARHVYSRLRDLNTAERDRKAFNWFESTGKDGDIVNRLNHKLRIWKIVPSRYMIDRGWQNDHLDSQGIYQGPDIDPTVRTSSHDNRQW